MNKANATESAPAFSGERLRETQDAFDSVAADYDGPRGNNDQIREMRSEMWRSLDCIFSNRHRGIALGCRTGLVAVSTAETRRIGKSAGLRPSPVLRGPGRHRRRH